MFQILIKKIISNYTSKFHLIRSNISTTAILNRLGDKFQLPRRYRNLAPNIWIAYTELAQKYKPANLGLGFPDFAPPPHIIEGLLRTAENTNFLTHQYTRAYGHPPLVTAFSKMYSKLLGFDIDPMKNILITIGGYEAIYCIILGLIEDGDEVIIMEPFFTPYDDVVKSAGGVPRYIPILPKENTDPACSCNWGLDLCELIQLFNCRTKMIIVNNPHNPLGKVFKLKELQMIAELCKKWNVICLSDEVYEWLIYDSGRHVRMASLPDMWERTITVGSVGKAFAATGWKIGWAYGPEELMINLQTVHQNSVYTCSTPLQESLAFVFEKEFSCLGNEDSFLCKQKKSLEVKRDHLVQTMCDVGMTVVVPEGGYFLVADWSPLSEDIDLSAEKDKNADFRFTKWMVKNIGVLGIPVSAFYCDEHACIGENYVRFCLAKSEALLKDTRERVQKWKRSNCK